MWVLINPRKLVPNALTVTLVLTVLPNEINANYAKQGCLTQKPKVGIAPNAILVNISQNWVRLNALLVVVDHIRRMEPSHVPNVQPATTRPRKDRLTASLAIQDRSLPIAECRIVRNADRTATSQRQDRHLA